MHKQITFNPEYFKRVETLRSYGFPKRCAIRFAIVELSKEVKVRNNNETIKN